jgi:hypothetical protein
MTAEPRILRVGEEPPPLDSEASSERRKQGARRGTSIPREKRQARDRFRTINAFLDATARVLPPSASLVWLLLWRDVKPDGLARTSQADLARRSGLCLRTVKMAVKTLGAKGLLVAVSRGDLRRGPSAYRLFPVAKGGSG